MVLSLYIYFNSITFIHCNDLVPSAHTIKTQFEKCQNTSSALKRTPLEHVGIIWTYINNAVVRTTIQAFCSASCIAWDVTFQQLQNCPWYLTLKLHKKFWSIRYKEKVTGRCVTYINAGRLCAVKLNHLTRITSKLFFFRQKSNVSD